MATNSLITSNVLNITEMTAKQHVVDMQDMDDISMPPSPKLNVLSKHQLNAKHKRMRQLKQELRNEEMKLVLLKKLRQSQQMKENIVSTNLPPIQPLQSSVAHNTQNNIQNNTHNNTPNSHSLNTHNNTHNTHTTNTHSTHNTHHSISHITNNSSNSQQNRSVESLTPSIRHHSISQNKNFSVLNAQNARNNQNIGHPLVSHSIGLNTQKTNSNLHQTSSLSSIRSSSLNSLNRTPVTTPPNVVLGYSVPEIRAQQQNNSILNSHSQTQNQIGLSSNGSPGPNPSEMSQTPAQRQAAAKLALRKQLEKTLLQIPPPKPPPPEMHFIPNANNQEFVYYLGLETVVDFLTDSPNQNRPPPDPFECVQCGTDFTPVWKWQDRIDPNRDRPAVICETCVTSNIKKALKAEHTNRLKTAFVKALQQEQEIEQRIASGAASPPLPPISPPSQPTNYNTHQSVSVTSPLVTCSQPMLPQAPPAHSSLSRLSSSSAAAAAMSNSAALLQQMPKLSAAHQSLLAAQAQQLHQLAQSLPQPQPAHMLPFAPLLAAQAYSYGMLGKSGVPSTDLHRQYLLDMIPPRSLPQGSINWKT